MTEATMKLFAETAKRLDIECDRHPTYSGRGMFGRTTCAISVNSMADFTAISVAAGTSMGDAASDFVEEMRNIRTDDLGMGIVVY